MCVRAEVVDFFRVGNGGRESTVCRLEFFARVRSPEGQYSEFGIM